MSGQMDTAKNAEFISVMEMWNTTMWLSAQYQVITLSIIAAFYAGLVTDRKQVSARQPLPKPNATGERHGEYGNVVDFRRAGTARSKES